MKNLLIDIITMAGLATFFAFVFLGFAL